MELLRTEPKRKTCSRCAGTGRNFKVTKITVKGGNGMYDEYKSNLLTVQDRTTFTLRDPRNGFYTNSANGYSDLNNDEITEFALCESCGGFGYVMKTVLVDAFGNELGSVHDENKILEEVPKNWVDILEKLRSQEIDGIKRTFTKWESQFNGTTGSDHNFMNGMQLRADYTVA